MAVPDVVAIDGVARHYAWGSSEVIPRLLGAVPDGRPVAELWFGAHPDDPSPVPDAGTALDAFVAADPERVLGGRVVARFGPRLPFLLKVLAVERPLSIQVHPAKSQAEAGFDAEQAAGVPIDAARRNYRDRNHKPELLCALTRFEALAGFRPAADTVRLLDALCVAALDPVRASCAAGDLRDAFTHLLRVPDPAPLADAVVARLGALDGGEWDATAGAVRHAAAACPGDVGVILALLLNAVRLAPGEAIYQAPGSVHAYLRGTGVEIMASSDNVLRCGLTPKHVDVDELLKITDFTELAEPRWPSDDLGFGREIDDPPVEDFRLHGVDLDAYRKPGSAEGSCATGEPGKPHVVLCVSGGVRVDAGRASVSLTPGRAAFVPARADGFGLAGRGQAFVATAGC